MAKQRFDVGVVGLGYVGLTLGTALADLGQSVLGIEKRADIVDLTNSGVPHFRELGLDYMLSSAVRAGKLQAVQSLDDRFFCDAYVITVGTPLKDGAARLDFIEHAAFEVARNMTDGALVMLRSTVKIGTTRNVVQKVLADSGKRFHLAMCPERTLEGRAMEELRLLPQIVGADQQEERERAARFFHRLTPTVIQLPKYEAAEIVKLIDNTYRDVQFGFANEVARVCEKFGVSAIDVIDSGKLGYPRTNVAAPGLVGGPCLEKDPHILNESVASFGIELEITHAARRVNERQPRETVETALDLYRQMHGDSPKTIAIFGVAFKGAPETNDLRGTMALPVFRCIRDALPEAAIRIFDPAAIFSEVQQMFEGSTVCESIDAALQSANMLFITNNNPAFGKKRVMELRERMGTPALIYDYWSHFARSKPEERKGIYVSVGAIESSVTD